MSGGTRRTGAGRPRRATASRTLLAVAPDAVRGADEADVGIRAGRERGRCIDSGVPTLSGTSGVR